MKTKKTSFQDKPYGLVFFGTSPRSAKFLEKAVQNGLKFDLVVSEPAKGVGRKNFLTENPTVTAAKKFNLPFLTSIISLQNPSSVFRLPSSKPTLGLILDFNKIIPKKIIDHFQKGIINIHFSRLPQYRGPAPVQYTILNGDKKAWITYYLISEELDQGKIIFNSSFPLDFTETTNSLYEKLIAKAANEAPKIIAKRLSDKDNPCQQTGIPTYTHKLTSENCRIDWSKSPVEVERLIRAAYPEPGAWSSVQICSKSGKIPPKSLRLKILKAHLEDSKLVYDTVQLEGKNPVSWQQFQQGYPEAKLI